jgi:hypothetical protein
MDHMIAFFAQQQNIPHKIRLLSPLLSALLDSGNLEPAKEMFAVEVGSDSSPKQ